MAPSVRTCSTLEGMCYDHEGGWCFDMVLAVFWKMRDQLDDGDARRLHDRDLYRLYFALLYDGQSLCINETMVDVEGWRVAREVAVDRCHADSSGTSRRTPTSAPRKPYVQGVPTLLERTVCSSSVGVLRGSILFVLQWRGYAVLDFLMSHWRAL